MSKQKSIPQRDAIPQEYTWNTADLYPTDEAWKEEFQTLKTLTAQLEATPAAWARAPRPSTTLSPWSSRPGRCSAS